MPYRTAQTRPDNIATKLHEPFQITQQSPLVPTIIVGVREQCVFAAARTRNQASPAPRRAGLAVVCASTSRFGPSAVLLDRSPQLHDAVVRGLAGVVLWLMDTTSSTPTHPQPRPGFPRALMPVGFPGRGSCRAAAQEVVVTGGLGVRGGV